MQSLRRLAESNGFSTLICLAETSVNICRTKWRARILQNYATLNVCPTMFGRFPSLKLTQDKMDPMHCVTLVNTWTAQTNRILLNFTVIKCHEKSGVGTFHPNGKPVGLCQLCQKLHARSLHNAVHKKRIWALLWSPCARLYLTFGSLK